MNASRRKRIALGSGVSVAEVNQLVERFFEAKKMMNKMAGQFGMGGGSRSATKKKPKGRKGKNGKRKPAKNRSGGMPNMGGMPGMPNMAELQKLQQQMEQGGGMPGMGGFPGMPKLPKGMENIDLNNLDFGQGKK